MNTIVHVAANNVDDLEVRPYANHPGDGCAAYFRDVVRHGVGAFIENASRTRMEVAVFDELCVPLVINDGAEDSCYFVSPHAHYVRYAREEIIKHMPRNFVSLAFVATLTALGQLGKLTGFNRHVSVNNWLFSTNPPLAMSAAQVGSLVDHLRTRFPTHAIVFRTVNAWDDATRRNLEGAGARLVANRDLYMWYPQHEAEWSRRTRQRIRADANFLRRVYARRPARAASDFALAARLYQALYCAKHSERNARFTARFFEATHQSGAADLEVFERDGVPRAIRTSFFAAPHLFALFVGYDPDDDPKAHRQYRSVIASCMNDARELGRSLFLSTGVAQFKRLRGGVPELEYEAVFEQHLPARRRLVWRLTQEIYDRAFESLDMQSI